MLFACGLAMRVVAILILRNPMEVIFSDPERHWNNAAQFLHPDPQGAQDPFVYQLYLYAVQRLTQNDRAWIGFATAVLSVTYPLVWYGFAGSVLRRHINALVEHPAGDHGRQFARGEGVEDLPAFLGLGLVRDGRHQEPPGDLVHGGIVIGKNQDAVAGVLALERPFVPGLKAGDIPADAVEDSGSGVDPHISVAYAELQSHRIARERGIPRAKVLALIDDNTDGRTLGVLGRPGVNVLEFNLALDREAAAR